MIFSCVETFKIQLMSRFVFDINGFLNVSTEEIRSVNIRGRSLLAMVREDYLPNHEIQRILLDNINLSSM